MYFSKLPKWAAHIFVLIFSKIMEACIRPKNWFCSISIYGHTLSDILSQANRILKEPLQLFIGRGYRGHD